MEKKVKIGKIILLTIAGIFGLMGWLSGDLPDLITAIILILYAYNIRWKQRKLK